MTDISRREAIGAMAAFVAVNRKSPLRFAQGDSDEFVALSEAKGEVSARFKQSISRWCYGKIPIDELCETAKAIRYSSVELLDDKDWATPAKHGLVCAMANGFGTIPVGFNRPDNHDRLVADAERMIPRAAAAGLPNIVCFSGNRAGLSDGEGIANSIAGFKRITPTAERNGVTLCLELLNSN